MTREEHIQKIVEQLPPLTAEQLEKLQMLLAISDDIGIMRATMREARR